MYIHKVQIYQQGFDDLFTIDQNPTYLSILVSLERRSNQN